MKRFLVFLITLGFLLPQAVKAAENPVRGGSLVVCKPAEPLGLDPTANTAAAIDRVVYGNIYEGLVKVNRQGHLVPCLARAWEISKDG
jgi:peptide/nickel transport system substrate-binding protein